MNVNNVNHGTHRPDQLYGPSVDKTDAAGVASTNEAAAASENAARDRVEISESARSASSDQAQAKRELDFARKAMLSIPPLSEDRAEDILKRVQEGYYSAPDVVEKLTQQVADNLSGNNVDLEG